MTITGIYNKLKEALTSEVQKHDLFGQDVKVTCKSLSAEEAIGKPEHDDYPIIRGKEVMVEAEFNDAKGQAFTDEFENAQYKVEDLLKLDLDSNRKRATFIAGLNAVYRYLQLCDKTIHCKDKEPILCAENLKEIIEPGKKVLLVGYQPRFFEILAANYEIQVVDLDPDNIGKEKLGIVIHSSEMTDNGLEWCDLVAATGSTIVNGTITRFINQSKQVLFYGVTISAPAAILNLKSYCLCGH